ncbi:flavin reductase family protein [Bradyrhizobium sp. BR 10289]|uniref:flavin reductase family protein n=1 Tax=Bradyrhizobium sp. BR 10289 TaxID=2749993 RepID=UPI001C650288|nr:flavin reductase family protein [Bradyrhizobium sp. BR 10289]MBW7970543.1 flavin reductase family protein [Bradyrhizobium sp. BR 10289]
MPEDFRSAMRRVAATVSVLSTELHGRRFGITVSSLASLTLEPPTLCFGLHRASSFCHPMIESGWVCVNVLSQAQESVGRAFATPPASEARFHAGRWSIYEARGRVPSHGCIRLPLLADAQANLVCRVTRAIEHGTHFLCLAEVAEVAIRDQVEPLLYCDGDYRQLAFPADNGSLLRVRIDGASHGGE